MTKKNKLILVVLFATIAIFLYVLVLDWLLIPRRSKDNLPLFANSFKNGRIYFEAVNQEVDIGSDNYFRDDGIIKDIEKHCRKIRIKLAGLNLLPLEEIDKIIPYPVDFVKGLCLTINISGKKFVIIFYEDENKTQAEIITKKVHEETHALIRLGKIDLIKKFLQSKNISVEYDQTELYRLCGLDLNKKNLQKIFSKTIRSKQAAKEEFLAQKMKEYYKQKQK
jgi:hypothetical protein